MKRIVPYLIAIMFAILFLSFVPAVTFAAAPNTEWKQMSWTYVFGTKNQSRCSSGYVTTAAKGSTLNYGSDKYQSWHRYKYKLTRIGLCTRIHDRKYTKMVIKKNCSIVSTKVFFKWGAGWRYYREFADKGCWANSSKSPRGQERGATASEAKGKIFSNAGVKSTGYKIVDGSAPTFKWKKDNCVVYGDRDQKGKKKCTEKKSGDNEDSSGRSSEGPTETAAPAKIVNGKPKCTLKYDLGKFQGSWTVYRWVLIDTIGSSGSGKMCAWRPWPDAPAVLLEELKIDHGIKKQLTPSSNCKSSQVNKTVEVKGSGAKRMRKVCLRKKSLITGETYFKKSGWRKWPADETGDPNKEGADVDDSTTSKSVGASVSATPPKKLSDQSRPMFY